MKKLLVYSSVFCLTSLFFPVTSQAKDPCQTLMCMAGEVTGGSGGSDCSGAISDFYKIVATKKHHRFDPGSTANARKAFLNSCAGAADNADIVSKIINKFGRIH